MFFSMKSNPLVSIIVPVYNACLTLDKCISSISAQTYNNIEIILIDDGSVDGSGDICECWKDRDSRIVVVHKENGGRSDARNAGLRLAQGEYIAFVDSDDFVEFDFVKISLQHLRDSDSDICVFGFSEVGLDGRVKKCRIVDKRKIHDSKKSTEVLLNSKKYYMWNKLFRARLFKDVLFPVGFYRQDIPVVGETFCKASKVVFIPDVLYNYVHTENSLFGTECLKKYVDHYEMLLQLKKIIKNNCPDLEQLVESQLIYACQNLCYFGVSRKIEFERLKEYLCRYCDYPVLKSRSSVKIKMAFVLLKISPKLFYNCIGLFLKK